MVSIFGEKESLAKEKSLFLGVKKALIIEPHNDDAWLSMGGLILKYPKIKFFIITLVNTEEGIAYTSGLKKLVKNVSTKQLAYKIIHNNEEEKEFFFKNKITNEQFEKKLRVLAKGFDLVFLPLGIFNPLHSLTSKLFFANKKVLRYADMPYYLLGGNQWRVRELNNNEFIKIDISKELGEKIRILRKCYNSADYNSFFDLGPGKEVLNFKSEFIYLEKVD